MIKTIAELLEIIKKAEVKKIEALKIKHRPTIGNTYEGLTSELLERGVFINLNINIVTNSFILIENGKRSEKFEIMIIEGKGKKIIYTKDQYDVNFDQVIAVIQ